MIQDVFPSRELQVLALVIGISTFVEAISGFGVSVLVVVPLLIGIGYSPLKAGVLSLLSQISVPLGALGVGTMVGAVLANLPINQVGVDSLMITLPLPIIFAFITLTVCGGFSSLLKFWYVALVCGVTKSVGDYYFSILFGIEIAGALASLITLLVLFIINGIRNKFYNTNFIQQKNFINNKKLFLAITPYAILVFTLALTRIFQPLQHLLTNILVIQLFGTNFQYPLFYIPGFWLTVAAFSVIVIHSIPLPIIRKEVKQTWLQFKPAGLTIIFFLLLAQVMILSNMTITISSVGKHFGIWYVVLAPIMGALSGWLTGSNSGGNAMFMPLQMDVSKSLGFSHDWTAAMQNASSSYGTMGSPARIALVCTTVNDRKIESKLLAIMIPYVLVSVLAIILLYYLLI